MESEEQKHQFVQQYEEKEGIRLDPAKIEVNKAMRSLAKLCLNSFWGKVRKAFLSLLFLAQYILVSVRPEG